MTRARERCPEPSGAGFLFAILAGAALVTSTAVAAERPFNNVCTFEAEDVSFLDAQVSVGGTVAEAEQAHAERAMVFIEQNGVRARVRVHLTAPFDAELTTENFLGASLSLRPGANVGGVVTAAQAGVVRVDAVARDGRTMTLEAGSVTVNGLPLHCDDLIAIKPSRSYGLHGTNMLVGGLYRLHASPGDAGFTLSAALDTLVSVSATPGEEWTMLSHAGSSSGVPAFAVTGWVRAPRLHGPGALGGGSIVASGFRPCAPGAPVRMELTSLAAGTLIYSEVAGDAPWTKLTAPTRALVATYATGRIAIAGLLGWSWTYRKCATGWLDPSSVQLDENNHAPTAKAAGGRSGGQ